MTGRAQRGGTRVAIVYAAPAALRFSQSVAQFFHQHAEREFDDLIAYLDAAPSGSSCGQAGARGARPWERSDAGDTCAGAGSGGGADRSSDPESTDAARDYALFSLSPGASWGQVQSAYRAACLKYHPDRLTGQNMPPHIIELGVARFRELTAAYQRLKQRCSG